MLDSVYPNDPSIPGVGARYASKQANRLTQLWPWLVAFLLACCLAIAASYGFGFSVPSAVATRAGKSLPDLPLTQRAWLDSTGKADIGLVMGLPEQEFSALPRRSQAALGPNAALWLRIDIQNLSQERRWLLVSKAVSIDLLSAYITDVNGNVQLHQAGTQIAVNAWPVSANRPSFELDLPAGMTQRVHVRAQDLYGSWADFELQSSKEQADGLLRDRLVIGLYWGVTLVVVALGLANFVAWRESYWLGYAGYCLLMALGQTALVGAAASVLWDNSPAFNEFAVYALVPLAAAAFLLFVLQVAQAQRFALGMLSWGIGLATFTVFCVALFAIRREGLYPIGAAPLQVSHWWLRPDSLSFASACSAYACGLFGLAVLLRSWRRGFSLAGQLTGAVALVLVCSLPQVLYSLKLTPRGEWTDESFVLGLVLESVLMLFVLHRHGRNQTGTKSRLGRLGVQDALTGLPPKLQGMNQLGTMLASASKFDAKTPLLVVSLVNFENLAKTHGHEAADGVLLLIAQLLVAERQEGDLVVRYGSNTFLLALREPLDMPQLRDLATKIVARSLMPTAWLAPHIKPELRIALMLTPSSVTDAQLAVRELLAQLHVQIHENASRRISVFNWPSAI